MSDPLLEARCADLEATLLTLCKEVTAAYCSAVPSAEKDEVLHKTYREMRRLGLVAPVAPR